MAEEGQQGYSEAGGVWIRDAHFERRGFRGTGFARVAISWEKDDRMHGRSLTPRPKTDGRWKVSLRISPFCVFVIVDRRVAEN